MYVWKNGECGRTYEHMKADIQKSIKIDKETFDIISRCDGRSFSDKVRKMAAEYEKLRIRDSGIR